MDVLFQIYNMNDVNDVLTAYKLYCPIFIMEQNSYISSKTLIKKFRGGATLTPEILSTADDHIYSKISQPRKGYLGHNLAKGNLHKWFKNVSPFKILILVCPYQGLLQQWFVS